MVLPVNRWYVKFSKFTTLMQILFLQAFSRQMPCFHWGSTQHLCHMDICERAYGLLSTTKRCADFAKQQQGRARQDSEARAGRHFSPPHTSFLADLCTVTACTRGYSARKWRGGGEDCTHRRASLFCLVRYTFKHLFGASWMIKQSNKRNPLRGVTTGCEIEDPTATLT